MPKDETNEIRSLIRMIDFMSQSIADLDDIDPAADSALRETKALLVRKLVYSKSCIEGFKSL